jgi:hypothetical protein
MVKYFSKFPKPPAYSFFLCDLGVLCGENTRCKHPFDALRLLSTFARLKRDFSRHDAQFIVYPGVFLRVATRLRVLQRSGVVRIKSPLEKTHHGILVVKGYRVISHLFSSVTSVFSVVKTHPSMRFAYSGLFICAANKQKKSCWGLVSSRQVRFSGTDSCLFNIC